MAFLDSQAALQAFLNRPGMATRLAGSKVPQMPSGAARGHDPLDGLLDTIQTLAQQYGWIGQYTYNAQGPDAGLHVTLVREVVLMAEVHRDGEALTPSQQRWVDALERTRNVETYQWTPTCIEEIGARLSQERSPGWEMSPS